MSNKPKKLFIAVIAFGVIGAGLYWRQPLARATTQLLKVAQGVIRVRSAPRNGMVAYWNFDDCDSCSTVTDKTGNGSTGTFAGAAARTNGKRGKGLSLSGAVGTRVTVPSAADSITDLTGPMSVSFWFYPQNDVGAIISKQAGGVNFPWEVLTHPTANDIRIGTSPGTLDTATGALTGKQNMWHHGVMVVNGTSRKFYLDNSLIIDTISTQSNLDSSAADIWFGDRAGSVDLPWQGLLDEVRIYNRALSADEIARLYEEDTYRTTINANQNSSFNSGLVGMWSFNGPDVDWSSASAEILDKSGNGNNGNAVSLTKNDVRAGVVGQALSFSGVAGTYVAIASAAGSVTDLTGPMSVSFWFYPQNDVGAIISKQAGGVNLPWEVLTHPTANDIRIGTSPGTLDTATGALTGKQNMWHHGVMVVNGTSRKFYLDNSLIIDTISTQSNLDSSAAAIWFGDRAGSADLPWQGLLDEVRLYNRALNASEIQELYLSSARQ